MYSFYNIVPNTNSPLLIEAYGAQQGGARVTDFFLRKIIINLFNWQTEPEFSEQVSDVYSLTHI